MNEVKNPVADIEDNRENHADIKDQDPKKPYFLNNPKHIPKSNPGVDNVVDVTKK